MKEVVDYIYYVITTHLYVGEDVDYIQLLRTV